MKQCFICGRFDICKHRELALLSPEERNRLLNKIPTYDDGTPKHANELQIIADSLFSQEPIRKPVEKSRNQPVDASGKNRISTQRR